MESGLSVWEAAIITSIWSFLFFGLNTTSTILLVISIIQIYKTHKKGERIAKPIS